MDATLERMSEQAKFAESVVKKVRSYAKNETKKEVLPLAPVIEKAVRRWLVVGNAHEHAATKLDPTITAEIDAFEIELLVVNLLRNASTALRSTANAKIHVRLEKSAENPKEALLVVADNGPKLKPEAVRAVTEPFTGYEGESMGTVFSSCVKSRRTTAAPFHLRRRLRAASHHHRSASCCDGLRFAVVIQS